MSSSPRLMDAAKFVCVVGATGNQGGSVARRFLHAGFRVRALTRKPSSASASALAALGADIVEADLDDAGSLHRAFAGAAIIFTVTNYWEPFFRDDCRDEARARGVSCRRYAGDVERQQGVNMADAAAATVATLEENGFIVSTLSHAGHCSRGRISELYHFDAKADVFPGYVREAHPTLAAKMSCVHTGYFFTSFALLPRSYFAKTTDGTIEMAFPTSASKPVPHLDPVGDMGNFVYAVRQMPPGRAYMAAGTTCPWPDFLSTWGRVAGYRVCYREVSSEEMVQATPDAEMGLEVALMFAYSSDPGYDGGMALLTADDIRAVSGRPPSPTPS
ncbi:hypothetical protein XA68_13674 [Ophiocordyceps unilateralis]|uniref:NmrA-like domain-containing protein n=1 Tax=Ophiocordyceps unilateralis TaxID=268505 RepID=A0A2A9PC92_OPHUN|nr:hypothetical protein XA68_13674 [Ophiocordyceps unilateralis]